MLVDDGFRECVAYLCVDRNNPETGAIERTPGATTFFIICDDDPVQVGYAITARHVIDDSRADGPLFIRVNKIGGGFDDIPAPQDKWTVDDDTDLAILELQGFQDSHYQYLPLNWIAADKFIVDNNVGPGDEVFFVGLFSQHSGFQNNQPIVRFGNISLMPHEKVKVDIGKGMSAKAIDAYLVEARSWGGHSGSPAFVYLSPFREMGKVARSWQVRLLGLVQGHFVKDEKVRIFGELSDIKAEASQNVGLAVVIPSQKILDLLNREDVLEIRKAIIEKVHESRQSARGADTESDN